MNNKKEIKLFQKMADLTLPKCKECRIPLSCCDKMYCTIAKDYANDKGIKLEETGNEKLPFMGENGCIVPPWLRPLCTLHNCSINNLGLDMKDQKFNDRYFELRQEIELLYA